MIKIGVHLRKLSQKQNRGTAFWTTLYIQSAPPCRRLPGLRFCQCKRQTFCALQINYFCLASLPGRNWAGADRLQLEDDLHPLNFGLAGWPLNRLQPGLPRSTASALRRQSLGDPECMPEELENGLDWCWHDKGGQRKTCAVNGCIWQYIWLADPYETEWNYVIGYKIRPVNMENTSEAPYTELRFEYAQWSVVYDVIVQRIADSLWMLYSNSFVKPTDGKLVMVV